RVGPAPSGRSGPKPSGQPDQLVLLVQNEEGYANAMKLVSKAYMESEPGSAPMVSLADLDGVTGGLIALTGGPAGPVGRLIAEGQRPHAEEVLKELARLFPGRLYVELMRHELEVE